MPESAEVRRLTSDLQDVVGSTISKVEIISGRYVNTPIARLDDVIGMAIASIKCKGKLIYFEFNNGDEVLYALSTLGMTGWWQQLRAQYKLNKSARFAFTIAGERQLRLVFNDTRNFGTFKLVSRDELNKKLNELGPDIALTFEPPQDLWERLDRFGKKKTIAEALLDQRIFCGVGNYMRAEALWKACLNPRDIAATADINKVEIAWKESHRLSHMMFPDEEAEGPERIVLDELPQFCCYGRRHDPLGNSIERYQDKNGRMVWYAPALQV